MAETGVDLTHRLSEDSSDATEVIKSIIEEHQVHSLNDYWNSLLMMAKVRLLKFPVNDGGFVVMYRKVNWNSLLTIGGGGWQYVQFPVYGKGDSLTESTEVPLKCA